MKPSSPEPFDQFTVPPSEDAPIPRWLTVVFYTLPIFGLIMLYAFWGGSFGWFDRGAWHELQEAANTTSVRVEPFRG